MLDRFESLLVLKQISAEFFQEIVFVGFNDGAAPGDDNDGASKAAVHAAVHERGAAVHKN